MRIVLIDDDEDVRGLLATRLDRLDGVRIVGQAGTGAEGLELIRALGPDAIVLDLQMPVMGGVAVLREIGASSERPLVAVLSADPTFRGWCLQHGADHFFEKPWGVDALVDTFDRASVRACSRPWRAPRASMFAKDAGVPEWDVVPAFRAPMSREGIGTDRSPQDPSMSIRGGGSQGRSVPARRGKARWSGA